jgi:hypothetical protein
MPDPTRMPEYSPEPPPARACRCDARTEFFRQEFVKHRECLALQKEYYSERAFSCVEAALTRVIKHMEQLSAKEDADVMFSRLLRMLNVVTGLSYWTDTTMFH